MKYCILILGMTLLPLVTSTATAMEHGQAAASAPSATVSTALQANRAGSSPDTASIVICDTNTCECYECPDGGLPGQCQPTPPPSWCVPI